MNRTLKLYSRRFLSILIALALMIQMLPAEALANEPPGSGASETTNTSGTTETPGSMGIDENIGNIQNTENIETIGTIHTSDFADPDVNVQILGEMEELRSENEKHFRLEDGSYLAVSYGLPVHYQGEDGTWQEIDNRMVMTASTDGTAAYRTADSLGTTAFATDLASGHLLTTGYDGYSISMDLLDTSHAILLSQDATQPDAVSGLSPHEPEPGGELTYARQAQARLVDGGSPQTLTVMNMPAVEQSGLSMTDIIPSSFSSSLLYEDVYPGADIRYTVYSYHVKEEIILHEPLSSYRFDFLLTLGGLEASLHEDGYVSLTNSESVEIYRIPAPYMMDAEGVVSDSVSYTLTRLQDQVILTLTADEQWIEDAQRVFPVIIDPTCVVWSDNVASADIYAATVYEREPNQICDGQELLYAGLYSQGDEHHTYLHFHTLPQIPAGSIVTNAILGTYLNQRWMTDCNECYVALYPVTDDVLKGMSDYYAAFRAMTWNRRPQFDSTNIMDYHAMHTGSSNEYRYWDMTELVKTWYQDSTIQNRTVALAALDRMTQFSSIHKSFARFDGYIASHPPILGVIYRSTTGIEPYYTYMTLDGGAAGTGYIADSTGQLKIVKEILSYASGTNPFSLNLIYNSDYFRANKTESFRGPNRLGVDIALGVGWTLDIIQKIVPETISGVDYLRFHDGDGTVHYFVQDSSREENYYYDEDGLGLKILPGENGSYEMSDDHGNTKTFTGGFLTGIRDCDGNQYIITYSNNQLTSIKQKNAGGDEITVASFSYRNQNFPTITDASGVSYSLTYGSNIMTGIKRNDTQITQYTYDGFRINGMKDMEKQHGIYFEYYPDGRIYKFWEIGIDLAGQRGLYTYPDQHETVFDHFGADRLRDTEDDIYTHYLFDNALRTTNVYTTTRDGTLVGADSAAYTAGDGTSKKNNRVEHTASIGMVGQQLLRNGGMEHDVSWNMTGHTGYSSDRVRTGARSLRGTLSGPSQTATAVMATTALTAGTTYTLSGYVRTTELTQITGDGVSFRVTDAAGNRWQSETVSHITSAMVNGGWTRIHVSFSPVTSGTHTITVTGTGAAGSFYVDDMQLEKGDVPSSYNLLENTTMHAGDHGWTLGSYAEYVADLGLDGDNALRIQPQYRLSTQANAWQEVKVMLPATETYVVSGWAKANAVPDNVTTHTDQAQDTEKQFGLRVTIYYQNSEDAEYHYIPFQTDLTGWQFVSGTVIPKRADAVVEKIRVTCAYEKNVNEVLFDNIALIREVTQTMRYDEDGNLVCVTTTGLDESSEIYSGGNLIQSITGGYGTYDYTYGTGDLSHRLLSVSNGIVKQDLSYDGSGNVTQTVLQGVNGGRKLSTGASYTNSGNLLSSVTDSSGQTVQYSYDTAQSIMLGLPTGTTDAKGHTQSQTYDIQGRPDTKSIANRITLDYNYTRGLLTQVVRTDSKGRTQTLTSVYDNFNSLTGIQIGSIPLATYEYAPSHGLLAGQTYGNGDSVSYLYDELERVTQITYSGGRILSYAYTGDGQLYSVTDNSATTDTSDDRIYTYTYDTLGRLLHCRVREGGSILVEIRWDYDGYNRVTCQEWQMGGESYRERYTYSPKDGRLGDILYGDNVDPEITLGYDGLQRRISAATDMYTRAYTYRDISSDQTTTQVTSVAYSGDVNKEFQYTYDVLGNILTYDSTDEAKVTYTYDDLGQLVQAATEGGPTYTYEYDSAGNLWEVTDGTRTDSYAYGNSSWPDLLTAYNGRPIAYEGQTYHADTNTVTGTPVSGNPVSYDTDGTRWTLDWAEGRNLTSASAVKTISDDEEHDIQVTYTYDASGLRTGKTVTTREYVSGQLRFLTTEDHDYIYAGGKLLRDTIRTTIDGYTAEETLDFHYDENGYPYSLTHTIDGTTTVYYYITNLQGDVMYLVDDTGTVKAAYTYDPYGNTLTATGILAEFNPLRYRGYVHEDEMGWYYVSSRYYDPQLRRFINADAIELIGANGDFVSVNLFAYCGNNPIIREDNGGQFWNIVAGAVSGAIISTLIQVVDNMIHGNEWYDGIVLAAANGAITGGLAASGAPVKVQAIVSGFAAAGTEYINQSIDSQIIDWRKVATAGVSGFISGAIGGDGIRHQNGDLAKAQKIYDYAKNGVKTSKWNAAKASHYFDLASNNLHKIIVKELNITTAKYTVGGAVGTTVKNAIMPVFK